MAEKADRTAAEEVVDRVNELANAGDEDADTPAQPQDPATPAAEAPARAESIDLDGETLTFEQIRELKRGGMFQADYTRKTQALAEERKALENERAATQQLIERYDSALKKVTGKEADGIDPNDPSVTPAVRRLLTERDRMLQQALEGVNSLREEIQQREQEREETRVAGFIVQTADDTIRQLMRENKVPDEWLDIYRDRIGNRDPDCADPISGQLTKQSIAAAIRKEFGVVHQGLAKLQGAATSTALKGLKPEPKPRTAAPATPGKKEESPHRARPKDAFDGAREETMERLSEAINKGAGEYV